MRPADVWSKPPAERLRGRPSSRVSVAWFRQWRRPAIAVSLAVLAIAGGTLMMLELSAPTYATAQGEQRRIELADGSTVELNSRSRIRVKYSKQERDVEIVEGQALFKVAHDANRPFIVAVGATRIRAIGTQFDVYKKSGTTVVSVVEGRVAVCSTHQRSALSSRATGAATERPPLATPTAQREPVSPGLIPGAGDSFLVAAGEQVTVTAESTQKAVRPNVSNATSWTRDEIVFEGATLSDVAAEFNRYNKRQLVIDDPDRLNFHISGTFSSADPESLIRFLRQRIGVRVTETGGQIRISAVFPSRCLIPEKCGT